MPNSNKLTSIYKRDLDEIILQLVAWKKEAGRLRIERDHYKRMVDNQRAKAVEEINARE